MAEDRKALSRDLLNLWSSESDVTADGIFGEGYLNHQEPDAAGDISDNSLEDYLEIVDGYHKGFSQSEVRFHMQIEEGDLVATRWTIKGVNDGEYLGHAPTGKTVEWTGIQIDRFRDGKIVESWVDWDKYRFMTTLGFI
ncbi:ester cyclase [Hoeflea sp. CAU 1731]